MSFVKVPSLQKICCEYFARALEQAPKRKWHPLTIQEKEFSLIKTKFYLLFQRSSERERCSSQLARTLPPHLVAMIGTPALLLAWQSLNPQEDVDEGWKIACQRRFLHAERLESSNWEQTFFAHLLDQDLAKCDFRKASPEACDLIYRNRHRIHTLLFNRDSIDDHQLLQIARLFGCINHFEMRNCKSLTGSGIIQILEKNKESLEIFKQIDSGWRMDTERAKAALLFCPRLKRIECDYFYFFEP